MKNRSYQNLIIAMATAAAVGCGGSGSGGSTGVTPSNFTRQVTKSIENGFFTRQLGGQVQIGSSAQSTSRVPGDVTFDTFCELWSRETLEGFDYFVDEALTQPAGATISTFTVDDTVFTQTETIDITAGPRQGFSSIFVTTKDGQKRPV